MATLLTSRLCLRRFERRDEPSFAAMNADPEVMRFFPAPLTTQQSNELMRRVDDSFEQHGFGWFAVCDKRQGTFWGCAGLLKTTFVAPFTPCVEIDWRLTRSAWGNGFATEAARAVLRWGFDKCGLEEVVSFTYENNWPSRKVMERLAMQRDVAGDFEHPRVDSGHRLRPHVLYRLRVADFNLLDDTSTLGEEAD